LPAARCRWTPAKALQAPAVDTVGIDYSDILASSLPVGVNLSDGTSILTTGMDLCPLGMNAKKSACSTNRVSSHA